MEETLWQDYWRESTLAARDRLIAHYLPFVRKVSLGLYKSWSCSELPAEDFIQYGTLGLIEAVEKYRGDREANFKTYAQYRIRGAILNAIGKFSEYLDYKSYQKRRERERLTSIVKNSGEGGPGAFERVLSLTLDFAVSHLIDRFDTVGGDDRVSNLPYSVPEDVCFHGQLIGLIDRLPDNMQKVLRLHYLEGVAFKEISGLLNLSKARVSQLHAVGLQKLRYFCRHRNALSVSF